MIYDTIGLPDHVLIVSQKLAIFCPLVTWGILVIARMDEFVHAPATSNELEVDDQVRSDKELIINPMKPGIKYYYLLSVFIINSFSEGRQRKFGNKISSMHQTGHNIYNVECI